MNKLNHQAFESIVKCLKNIPYVIMEYKNRNGDFPAEMINVYTNTPVNGVFPNIYLFFHKGKEASENPLIPTITIYWWAGDNKGELVVLSYDEIRENKNFLVSLIKGENVKYSPKIESKNGYEEWEEDGFPF